VDLGSAGVYQGSVINDGKVKTWRGIPYAAPPVGSLRFRPPQTLQAQNDSVQDFSQDFPDLPTSCVQFGTTSWTKGPNAGPGVEDCLRLWIFTPANSTQKSKLPVHLYYHGGGMQNGMSASHDYQDWVGADQGVITVNANYRLGLLGFWNSQAMLDEGYPVNTGLLDAQFAVDWVVKHISKFGGDPYNIAISGQSGGGGLVKDMLVLFDGKKAQYQKAIPRSIQRSPQYTVKYLSTRNNAFAASVNCTDVSAQLECMRALPAETIRLAALDFADTTDPSGGPWGGWLPSVDGISLTDHSVNLYREGKIAPVAVMPSAVSQEFGGFLSYSEPLTADLVRQYGVQNMSDELVNKMLNYYPAPIINSSYDTGTYPDGTHQVWSYVDDSLAKCSVAMLSRAYSKAGLPAFEVRFNAPQPRSSLGSPDFPAWTSTRHSSDNYYLENTTSLMNSTEAAVAFEWRSYISSFMTYGDPSKGKLETSPKWFPTIVDTRYSPRMVISQAINATAQPQYPTNSGMELMDPAEFDRCSFWLSNEVADVTRQ